MSITEGMVDAALFAYLESTEDNGRNRMRAALTAALPLCEQERFDVFAELKIVADQRDAALDRATRAEAVLAAVEARRGPMAGWSQGICPVCERRLAVTPKGVMRAHPERSSVRCSGTGQPPARAQAGVEGRMSGVMIEADLCHKGNYENIVGQPDMVHTPTPGVIPDLVWFTCASEANGVNMFPCTGSRHIDHRTVVVCTCTCHTSRDALSPEARAFLADLESSNADVRERAVRKFHGGIDADECALDNCVVHRAQAGVEET